MLYGKKIVSIVVDEDQDEDGDMYMYTQVFTLLTLTS
jgi:hypothetical protein